MGEERTIKVRDRLNQLIEDILKDSEDDQEAHVLACCVAIAVEEVEKYLYKGEFTPSVVPYRDGKEWKWTVDPSVPDNEMTGPPWKRVRKSIMDRMPVLKRLKGKKFDTEEPALPKWGLIDLTITERNAFCLGDRGEFLRRFVGRTKVSIHQAEGFLDRLKGEYPFEWGKFKESTKFV